LSGVFSLWERSNFGFMGRPRHMWPLHVLVGRAVALIERVPILSSVSLFALPGFLVLFSVKY
jgi:hypothetical protein